MRVRRKASRRDVAVRRPAGRPSAPPGVDDRLPEFLDADVCRVERQDLVEEIVQSHGVQGLDGGDQLLALTRPVIGAGTGARRGVGLFEQFSHLADRDASVQPLQDAFDALDVFTGIEPMSLGGAMGPQQAIAALPGPQGHRVDTGQARDFANRITGRVAWGIRLVAHAGLMQLSLMSCAFHDCCTGWPGCTSRRLHSPARSAMTAASASMKSGCSPPGAAVSGKCRGDGRREPPPAGTSLRRWRLRQRTAGGSRPARCRHRPARQRWIPARGRRVPCSQAQGRGESLVEGLVDPLEGLPPAWIARAVGHQNQALCMMGPPAGHCVDDDASVAVCQLD